MKKIIIGLLIIVIISLGGFLVFHGQIKNYINSQLRLVARQSGGYLYFKESALSPLALSYKNLTLSLPHIFVDIIFDELKIIPAWLQTLRLSPTVRIKGELYSGSLEGAANLVGLEQIALQNIVLRNLSLSEHPMIKRLGFGGITSFEGDLTKFKFQLANGAHDKEIPLSVPYNGNLLTLTLPEMSDLNITATAERVGKNIRLTNSSFSSNLGEGDCTGKYDLTVKTANLKCKVSLSSEGIRELESYLVLASNGVLSVVTPRFIVKIQYNIPQRRLTREFEILQ